MGRVDDEPTKLYIMNECRQFINSICKIEQLYENIYTFRFFKEQKYDNYLEHKKKIAEHLVNHMRLLRNTEGCVPI